MAKFYGPVGYAQSVETTPGVFKERIITHNYYGDVIKNSRNLQSSDSTNDSINVANEISIVADQFANENFHSMRYVEFMGTKWKIKNVDVQFPRLILTMGGVYNGQQT
jgi:hypothetical protein